MSGKWAILALTVCVWMAATCVNAHGLVDSHASVDLRLPRNSQRIREQNWNAKLCPNCPSYNATEHVYVSAEFGSIFGDGSQCNPVRYLANATTLIRAARDASVNKPYIIAMGAGTLVEPGGVFNLDANVYLASADPTRASQLLQTTVGFSDELCATPGALFAGIDGVYLSRTDGKPVLNYACKTFAGTMLNAFTRFSIFNNGISYTAPTTKMTFQSTGCTHHGPIVQNGGAATNNGDDLFFSTYTLNGVGTATTLELVSGDFRFPVAPAVSGLIINGNGTPVEVILGHIMFNFNWLNSTGTPEAYVTIVTPDLPLIQFQNVSYYTHINRTRDASSDAYTPSPSAKAQVWSQGLVSVQDALNDLELVRHGLQVGGIVPVGGISRGVLTASSILSVRVGNNTFFQGSATVTTTLLRNTILPGILTVTFETPTNIVPSIQTIANGHVAGSATLFYNNLLGTPVSINGRRVVSTAAAQTSISFQFYVDDFQIPVSAQVEFQTIYSLV